MCNDGELRISYLSKSIEKGCGKLYNIIKRSQIKGTIYMKPRIFISSTCYDLKFVREDLADFIKEYYYEPILSENGDIGYLPGQNLDKSCYDAMQTADMVILIIGSEYGSAASGETKDGFVEYISITRKEFRTAMEAGIPVFAMIDKKVMAEYGIYEVNVEKIEKNNLEIKFKIVKDLNVFRFIKEIKGMVNIPIQEFEKSSDIKEFIRKQWADMFKNYLVSLKEEKENKKIASSVNEMKALIKKMDIMLESVGRNVLSKENSNEYEEVINQQEILAFCDAVAESFNFLMVEIIHKDDRKMILSIILNYIKEISSIDDISCEDLEDLLIRNGYEVIEISLNINEYFRSHFDLLHNSQKFEKVIEILSEDKYEDMIQ